MSCVIVRFCGATDIISRIVRAGCYGYEYSHVEIVLPSGDAIGAHASNGVAILSKDALSKDSYRQLVVIPCTAEQEAACTSFLMDQLGKGYDFKAIAAIAASFFIGPRDWRDDERWFCSELVTAALEHAGIISRLCCEAQRITPRDLDLILSSHAGAIRLEREDLLC